METYATIYFYGYSSERHVATKLTMQILVCYITYARSTIPETSLLGMIYPDRSLCLVSQVSQAFLCNKMMYIFLEYLCNMD